MMGALLTLALAAADVGWAPPPDAHAPLDMPFRDETGARVTLGDYTRGGPAVLVLGYYGCSNVCGATLDGLGASLLEAHLAGKVPVVAVSVDPSETPPIAAARKRRFATRGSDWHFLTGDARAIGAVASGVGFGYRADPATHQILHPAGVMVLAGDGHVARYLGGVSFEPVVLAGAIAAAGRHQLAPSLPDVLLRCFHYDPATASAHTTAILAVLRWGACATALALLVLVAGYMRRDARKHSSTTDAAAVE